MSTAPAIRRVALLGLLLGCAGCGERIFPGPRIRLGFVLDFERAVREGRLEADADREWAAAETLAAIRQRLDAYGIDWELAVLRDDAFEISIPVGLRPSLDSIVQVVTARGDLRFRIEVLPASFYGRWNDGKTAPRLQQEATRPWRGTDVEFHAFRQREVEAFIEARETGTAYVPSDPRYFVVPRHGTEGTDVHEFVVLEEPSEARFRFGGSALKNPLVARDPHLGKPVVLYQVKAELHDAFEAWTSQNVGLPLAIVLNDVYRSAPIINGALRNNVQITLGGGSMRELEQEAEELSSVLRSGALPLRPTLVSIDDPEREQEDR